MTDLTHVGVIGMRWGIRKRGPASSEHTRTQEIKKKHVTELSNDELKTAITRLQLEKQYKDLNAVTVGKGQRIVGSILQRVGGMLINNYIKQRAGPGFAGYEAFAQAIRNKGKSGG